MVTNYDYIKPPHYRKGSKEVWEMMIDIWGKEAFVLFCEMNAFKYRMRMGDKPGQSIEDDLKKAQWYEDKANEYRGVAFFEGHPKNCGSSSHRMAVGCELLMCTGIDTTGCRYPACVQPQKTTIEPPSNL